MMKIKKIFAVSFIAMAAVSAAHATVVTQTNVVGANGVSVSVPASGQTNAGKLVISGPDLSGKQDDLTVMSVSEGQTGTAETERSINAKNLRTIVQGTSSAAGLGQGSFLGPNYAKSNSFGTDLNIVAVDTVNTAIGKLEKKADDAAEAALSIAYDKQDDLTVMSVSEGQTGTATTERSMDAAKLKEIVQGSSTAAGLGQGSVLGPNYAKP